MGAEFSLGNVKRVHNLLTKAGYRPVVLNDAVITLNVEGVAYIVVNEESDPNYYQITMPFEWRTLEEERSAIIEAFNIANTKSKLAKLYLDGESGTCSVQVIAQSAKVFVDDFPRYISAIRFALDTFIDGITPTSGRR